LIFSTSLEEHIQSIRKIFETLRKWNLKIQFDKCSFLAKETEYLGHILTPEGVKPNPNKIQNIINLKLPTTQKQIKSFLGITGYYRKFVKDYAKVAQPLLKYLKKGMRINTNDSNYIAAFEKLKRIITDHPVLKYPDFKKKFQLFTDASDYAIGAVLQQDNHPVCYASRTLNDHEKNYSITEKELLAIVWAVGYFRPYIYGVKFDLLTDHMPLKWLFAKTKGKEANLRLLRWVIKLAEFNINADYVKGKENNVADFLSRIDADNNEINVLEENVEADLNSEISIANNVDENDLDTIHSQEEDLNDHFPILDTVVNRFKTQIFLTNNKTKEFEKQNNNRKIYINSDDINNNLFDILRRYIKPGRIGIFTELNDHEYNLFQQKAIELFGNIPSIKFVRCSFKAREMNSENEAYKQIEKYHKYETGHTGINENYEGLKKLIFFPNLKTLIQKYINNCDTCNRVKYDRNPIKEKFKITETPKDIKEIIHMDIYTNSKNNFLTFIDRFSKFATAFYLNDRNNQTIIEKLREFKSQRGYFKKLIADNEFKSVNIKDFLKNENIKFHLVKSNNHTGNSDIERLHSTLGEKIRTLGIESKNLSINEKMSKAIEWYNNSYHSVTKEKPINVQDGNCDKKKIYENLLKEKLRIIEKRNKVRENYSDNRAEGYIKNYKSLRHKEEPKFIKSKLENVHSNNIKRKSKFLGDLDINNIPGDDHDNPRPSTSGQN
jgi:hypothetical protein